MNELQNSSQSKSNNTVVGLYLENITREELLAACLYTVTEQTSPVDMLILTHGLKDSEKALLNTLASEPYYPIANKNEEGVVVHERKRAEKKLNYKIVEIDKPLGFSAIFNEIFNYALKNDYEVLSVVEQEDTYSLKWNETCTKWYSEKPDTEVLLPLSRNSVNGAFINLMNEAAFSESLGVEEFSRFDLGLLTRYNCIAPLGGYYIVKKWKKVKENDAEVLKLVPAMIAEYSEVKEGKYLPMKESIKYAHYYEFFLRMIYNDAKVYALPRILFELNNVNREVYTDATCKLPANITSIPVEKGGITQQEGQFWFEFAKKNLYFDKDQNKTYQSSLQKHNPQSATV